MSIYTTIYVTRNKAIKTLSQWIDSASDWELSEMMRHYLEPQRNNCIITNNVKINDDHKVWSLETRKKYGSNKN